MSYDNPHKSPHDDRVMRHLYEAGAVNFVAAIEATRVAAELGLTVDAVATTIGYLLDGRAICCIGREDGNWPPKLFVSVDSADAFSSCRILDHRSKVLSAKLTTVVEALGRACRAGETLAGLDGTDGVEGDTGTGDAGADE